MSQKPHKPDKSETRELLKAVGRYLASRFPRWRDGHLRVNVGEPSPFVLPVPRSTEPADEGEAPAADRETVEEHAPAPAELSGAILRVLGEAGRPLKSVVIAHRLGKPYDGHLRRVLKQLVDDGAVERDPREKTYHLPATSS